MKMRSLIALVVLVPSALFLAAAGPDGPAKAKKGSPAPASYVVSPGFHRGG